MDWGRTYHPAQVDLDVMAWSELISLWKYICVTEQSGEQKPTAQTLIPHLEDLAVGRADLIPASLAPNSASLLEVPLHCTAMVRDTRSPVQYRTLVYALDYSGGSQRRQLRFQETRKETSVCYFPLLVLGGWT